MGRLCGERMGPGCAAVSVASDRREQETRLGAGGGCRWGILFTLPGKGPAADGRARRLRHGGRGCTGPLCAMRGGAAPALRRMAAPAACVMGGGAAPVLLRASVSSVQRMRETRLGAGGGAYRRAMLVVPAGKGAAACARSRRGRRVPAPTARAMGAGLARHVARKRFECPKDARNAAWGRRRRISPGHACCPSRQGSRRVRPLPPRQARRCAHRSRHGGGAGPACCAQAFRAPLRRKKRASPHPAVHIAGPCARTSRQRFGGPQPSKMYSYRPASPGGRGVCAPGRKHSLRRPPPGEAGGKAAGEVGGRRNPSEKIGASRAFPTRSYSILASASLTSSIRRATWEGVSTGWLNSTVWFTVTGAAACVCAASRS